MVPAYQYATPRLVNVYVSTEGTPTMTPSTAPTVPDHNADLEIIEAALQTMAAETRFEALGKLALAALGRVRAAK